MKYRNVLFCGAQGTGKTTQLNLLKTFAFQRLEAYFGSVTFLDHTASRFFKTKEDFDSPRTFNLQKELSDYQTQLFQKPNIVSSRSFADLWAYTAYLRDKKQDMRYQGILDDIELQVLKVLQEPISLFVYFPIIFPIQRQDVLKSSNVEFQKDIDHYIQEFIEKLEIPVLTLQTPDNTQRHKLILETIFKNA